MLAVFGSDIKFLSAAVVRSFFCVFAKLFRRHPPYRPKALGEIALTKGGEAFPLKAAQQEGPGDKVSASANYILITAPTQWHG